MSSFNLKIMSIAMTAALALSGCGGGGDGGSSTAAHPAQPGNVVTQPPSNVPSAKPPQTTAPTPSYAADSMQAYAFARLNQLRSAIGVGMLEQDTKLDTSAQAHAQYLWTNLASGQLTALSHDELANLPGFYGATSAERALRAGVGKETAIGEVVAEGYPQLSPQSYADDCVIQFYNTIYHLEVLTYSSERVGFGFQQGREGYPNYSCVVDTGTDSGQWISERDVVHVPYADETDVASTMHVESPNPAPDLATPGRPIMVKVNAASGNVLTVSNFQLVDNTGAQVPARILVNDKAAAASKATVQPDPKVWQGVAFLLPLQPLKPNTTYTVTFAGERDATPMNTTWSFTTAAK